MYKAQQTPPTDGASGAGPQAGAQSNGAGQQEKKDEGVIDAEYVDVEDKR
jgi:hypothetical protein